MLAWFILGFCLLVGVLLSFRWFVNAEPKQVIKALRWIVVIVISLFFMVLLATGRLHWAAATIGAVIPFALRGWRIWQISQNIRRAASWAAGQKGAGGWSTPGSQRPSGDASRIKTGFLDMELDHNSGKITGKVISGPHSGARLDDLSESDLLSLHRHYQRVDDESVRVLEAYLDRRIEDWRSHDEQAGVDEDQANHHSNDDNAPMTKDRAYQVLGLKKGASEADIKKAYHRLMGVAHPDHGGSDFLAAQLNRAKEILLKGG